MIIIIIIIYQHSLKKSSLVVKTAKGSIFGNISPPNNLKQFALFFPNTVGYNCRPDTISGIFCVKAKCLITVLSFVGIEQPDAPNSLEDLIIYPV